MKKKNSLLKPSASSISFNLNLLKSSFFISVSLLISGCSVVIPNTKFFSVAGVVEAGMDGFETLGDKTYHINPEEIKSFLEPMADVKDKNGVVIQKGHGAAICQYSEDWGAEHMATEEACQKLGASCTYDVQKLIDDVGTKMQSIQKAGQ